VNKNTQPNKQFSTLALIIINPLLEGWYLRCKNLYKNKTTTQTPAF